MDSTAAPTHLPPTSYTSTIFIASQTSVKRIHVCVRVTDTPNWMLCRRHRHKMICTNKNPIKISLSPYLFVTR